MQNYAFSAESECDGDYYTESHVFYPDEFKIAFS